MIQLKAIDKSGKEYPKCQYMFYSLREAKKRYREGYGLKGKHLTWL